MIVQPGVEPMEHYTALFQVQEAILHLLEQLQHHHQQLLPDRPHHPHAGVRAARAGDRGGPRQVELSNFVIN